MNMKKLLGKRLHDFLYNTVFKIPMPTGRGDWPGDPLPSRNFPVKEMDMHERRSFDYNGMAVRPPRIAQQIVNAQSHMVVASNRGREFDAVWKHLIGAAKFALHSALSFMAGVFLLVLSLDLWPITMLIWMYSGLTLGEFFVTRHRYYTARSRQTIPQNLGLPSERWSNIPHPFRGG